MRKLNKKYLDHSKNLGVFERSYVLCHDDDTAELFLYFCKDYESFFNSDKKDEVFFYWQGKDLVVWVDVYNEKSKFSSKERLEIFKKHIKNSVLAFYRLEEDAKIINPKLSILFYDRKKLIDKEVYPSLNLYVDDDTKFDTNIKY